MDRSRSSNRETADLLFRVVTGNLRRTKKRPERAIRSGLTSDHAFLKAIVISNGIVSILAEGYGDRTTS